MDYNPFAVFAMGSSLGHISLECQDRTRKRFEIWSDISSKREEVDSTKLRMSFYQIFSDGLGECVGGIKHQA